MKYLGDFKSAKLSTEMAERVISAYAELHAQTKEMPERASPFRVSELPSELDPFRLTYEYSMAMVRAMLWESLTLEGNPVHKRIGYEVQHMYRLCSIATSIPNIEQYQRPELPEDIKNAWENDVLAYITAARVMMNAIGIKLDLFVGRSKKFDPVRMILNVVLAENIAVGSLCSLRSPWCMDKQVARVLYNEANLLLSKLSQIEDGTIVYAVPYIALQVNNTMCKLYETSGFGVEFQSNYMQYMTPDVEKKLETLWAAMAPYVKHFGFPQMGLSDFEVTEGRISISPRLDWENSRIGMALRGTEFGITLRELVRDANPNVVVLTEEEAAAQKAERAAARKQRFEDRKAGKTSAFENAGDPSQLEELKQSLIKYDAKEYSGEFRQLLRDWETGAVPLDMPSIKAVKSLARFDTLADLFTTGSKNLYEILAEKGFFEEDPPKSELPEKAQILGKAEFLANCKSFAGLPEVINVAMDGIKVAFDNIQGALRQMTEYTVWRTGNPEPAGKKILECGEYILRNLVEYQWCLSALQCADEGALRVIESKVVNSGLNAERGWECQALSFYSKVWPDVSGPVSYNDLFQVMGNVELNRVLDLSSTLLGNYMPLDRIAHLFAPLGMFELTPEFFIADKSVSRSTLCRSGNTKYIKYVLMLYDLCERLAAELLDMPAGSAKYWESDELLEQLFVTQAQFKGAVFPAGTDNLRGIYDYDRELFVKFSKMYSPDVMSLLQRYLVYWG